MPKHSGPSVSVKYVGIFDYPKLYLFLYNLVKTEGYTIMSDSHSEKHNPNGGEVEITWKFEKIVDDYTKFTVNVYILIKDFLEVIVKKKDKEVKQNKGSILINFKGDVITDWKGKWDSKPFLRKLRKFYEAYLFKGTLSSYNMQMYKLIHFFAGEAKSFFELPKFMEIP